MKYDNNCPKCKRKDALGSPWHNRAGRVSRTCHGTGRPEHLGYKVHFDEDTGEEIQQRDSIHARVLNLLSVGNPMPFRGFSGRFLQEVFGVSGISAAELDAQTHISMPSIGMWGKTVQRQGYALSMLPITQGPHLVGLQIRPLHLHDTEGIQPIKDFRTIGESEGLLIPHYTGINPSAVVIHEGPWGAIACMADALDYGNVDIIPVAVLNAGVKASTIRKTLDLIFPGVPRYSLFDQDPAGVAARMATFEVAKPILITGAGPGKDYRDLIPELRFERLVEIIVREAKALEARS